MTSEHDQPDLPEEEIAHLPPYELFVFDPVKMRFVVTSTTSTLRLEVSPGDLQDIGGLELRREVKDLEAPIVAGRITREPLVIMPWTRTLIVMPSLREWLRDADSQKLKEVFERSRGVIETVFEEIAQRDHVPLPRKQIRYFLKHYPPRKSFGETFSLDTVGSCACLGPNPEPIFMSYRNQRDVYQDLSLPVELVLHNADIPARTISLYAGAGTIAWLAREDIFRAL